MKLSIRFLSSLAMLAVGSATLADKVLLIDGETIIGVVTKFDFVGFDIRLPNGKTRRFATDDVVLIDFERHESKPPPRTKVRRPILLTPETVIRKAKLSGLHEEMGWRRSNLTNEWIAQLKCFNRASGSKLTSQQVLQRSGGTQQHNELNVQLLGATADALKTVRIEAEIYDARYASATLKLATDTIESLFPDCPPNVVAAFKGGRPIKSGDWEVSRDNHNAGYDLKLVRKIGG